MKLYTALNESGLLMKQFKLDNKIEEILTVGDAQSLGLKPNILNEELFKQQLEELIPDINYIGICFLDIEDEYGNDLMNKESGVIDFQNSLTQFIRVIKFAKQLRPNVKWGYYGIPFTTYWERTPEFYLKNSKIDFLLKECDILFPSLYNFYRDDEQTNLAEENEKYARENTVEMIKLGLIYNKPVIAFVWHRYHPSTKHAMETMTDEAFLKHIEILKDSSYQGKKMDGIVWWSADDYFFRQGEIKSIYTTNEEFSKYNDEYLFKLSTKVQNLLLTNTPTPIIEKPKLKKRCWFKILFNIK